VVDVETGGLPAGQLALRLLAGDSSPRERGAGAPGGSQAESRAARPRSRGGRAAVYGRHRRATSRQSVSRGGAVQIVASSTGRPKLLRVSQKARARPPEARARRQALGPEKECNRPGSSPSGASIQDVDGKRAETGRLLDIDCFVAVIRTVGAGPRKSSRRWVGPAGRATEASQQPRLCRAPLRTPIN